MFRPDHVLVLPDPVPDLELQHCLKQLTNNKVPYGVIDLIPELAVRFLIAYNCTRWCGTFKVLSQDEGGADFSKNLRTSSLTKAFRINQIFGGFISLNSTFKDPNQDPESGSCKRLTRIRIQ